MKVPLTFGALSQAIEGLSSGLMIRPLRAWIRPLRRENMQTGAKTDEQEFLLVFYRTLVC